MRHLPNSSMTPCSSRTSKEQRPRGTNLTGSNLLTENNGVTEPDAASLVAALRARGIRFVVYRRRGGIDIVLRPHRLVTDEDRTALRDRWEAVKALVLDEWERENAS